MDDLRSRKAAGGELLPWQAAVMVVCVTMAGLLHEHPGVVRPLLSGLQASQMGAGRVHTAEVRNIAVGLGR